MQVFTSTPVFLLGLKWRAVKVSQFPGVRHGYMSSKGFVFPIISRSTEANESGELVEWETTRWEFHAKLPKGAQKENGAWRAPPLPRKRPVFLHTS